MMVMPPQESVLDFLLVEDNDDHATLVRKTLQAERIANELRVFEDAESALSYLRSDHRLPQVILLDINLPGMSGLDLLQILKQDQDLKNIPTVVLSTSESEADRARAYEYSANSYLTKPIDFDSFRKMVRDLGFYWGFWNQPSV